MIQMNWQASDLSLPKAPSAGLAWHAKFAIGIIIPVLVFLVAPLLLCLILARRKKTVTKNIGHRDEKELEPSDIRFQPAELSTIEEVNEMVGETTYELPEFNAVHELEGSEQKLLQ